MARNLLLRNLDADDPHIPLLLWWAVEQHAVADFEDTLARFTSPAAWHCAMISSTILGRLVRRLAAERTARGDTACARVLTSAPSVEARKPLLIELDQAMSERRGDTVAPPLAQLLLELADRQPDDSTLTRMAARLGSRAAIQRARAIIANDRVFRRRTAGHARSFGRAQRPRFRAITPGSGHTGKPGERNHADRGIQRSRSIQ